VKTILSFGLLILLGLPATALGQASSEDVSGADFLPPVQGGDESVEKPAEVKVKEEVVQAASAQDAMNVAVKENIKEIANDPEAANATPEVGVKWLKFGSGVGVLATGVGMYVEMPNPTATRMAQRNAYVVAYVNAKAAMARSASSISNEGRDVLETASSQINGAETYEKADVATRNEMIKQAADALIKGYVTYAIKEIADSEDPTVRFVYVSIASTPKSQKLVTRQGAVYQVEKLIDGLNEMVRDIKKGIVPPVGGRVITVPKANETAFVGFGSAIVGTSRNRAFLAKMKLDAQKIAAARARDSLQGIIGGDRVIWQTGVESKNSQEFKESLTYAKKDPLAQDNSAIEETLASYSSEFKAERKFSETMQSLRKGILPPGIKERVWLSEDGQWAYSMMVYYPPLTNFAAATARKMREANLIAPVDDSGKGFVGSGKNANKKADDKTRTIDGRVKPLKGGKVSPKEDL
jgi:hypothetical protein